MNNVNYDKEIHEILRLAGVINESVLDDKVFYCSTISRLLKIAETLGQIRFYYDFDKKFFVIGNANIETHIGLFSTAIDDGKYPELLGCSNEECEEYYQGIEGVDLTGAILMKNRTKDLLSTIPDSTNVVYEYQNFYLCNGLLIKDKISQYVKENPKQVY